MTSKTDYSVVLLKNGEHKEWLLKKHYAKRTCSVSYAYGLIYDNKIVGVCTFGFPPNYNYNDGKCIVCNEDKDLIPITNDGGSLSYCKKCNKQVIIFEYIDQNKYDEKIKNKQAVITKTTSFFIL